MAVYGDLLESHDELGRPRPLSLPPTRPGGGGRLIATLATTIAVVAPSGVVGGAPGAVGGGPAREDVAPATSIGFAKVDLDPGVGAKVGIYRFARHFPHVPEGS